MQFWSAAPEKCPVGQGRAKAASNKDTFWKIVQQHACGKKKFTRNMKFNSSVRGSPLSDSPVVCDKPKRSRGRKPTLFTLGYVSNFKDQVERLTDPLDLDISSDEDAPLRKASRTEEGQLHSNTSGAHRLDLQPCSFSEVVASLDERCARQALKDLAEKIDGAAVKKLLMQAVEDCPGKVSGAVRA